MMDNWTCVYTSAQMHKADTVRMLLAEENIEAVVMNRKDSSYLFGEAELYVQSGDADAAAALIKNFHIE